MCTCDRLDTMLALYAQGIPLQDALQRASVSREQLADLLESATEVMARDKWGGEAGLADAIVELLDLQRHIERTLDLLDQIREHQDRMFDRVSQEIKRLTEGRLQKPRHCSGRVVRIAGDSDECGNATESSSGPLAAGESEDGTA